MLWFGSMMQSVWYKVVNNIHTSPSVKRVIWEVRNMYNSITQPRGVQLLAVHLFFYLHTSCITSELQSGAEGEAAAVIWHELLPFIQFPWLPTHVLVFVSRWLLNEKIIYTICHVEPSRNYSKVFDYLLVLRWNEWLGRWRALSFS